MKDYRVNDNVSSGTKIAYRRFAEFSLFSLCFHAYLAKKKIFDEDGLGYNRLILMPSNMLKSLKHNIN